jgi:arylformamidase
MVRPRRVHDLTARLESFMSTWAGSPLPVFEPTAIVAREGYSIERISCTSHTGTHMDAPYHFVEDGLPVDRIPPEQLVGRAAVLDVRHELDGTIIPTTTLRKHWPTTFDPEIVLLRSDWSHKRGPTKEYLFDFPGLDPPAAEFLVSKSVKGVGTDTLGIDPYSNTEYEAHKVLLRRGIWVLEAMDNLAALSEGTEYTLIAAPIKIANGSGGLARVLAIEE